MLVRQYTDRLNRANTTLWSVSEIIEYLLKTDEEVCFSDYSRMFIRQMRLDGHERNAKNYQLAVAHLERYMGTTRVMFGHLTAAVLKKWIKKDGILCGAVILSIAGFATWLGVDYQWRGILMMVVFHLLRNVSRPSFPSGRKAQLFCAFR